MAIGGWRGSVWEGWLRWLAEVISGGADESAKDVTHAAQGDLRVAEFERFVRAHERAILNYLWRMTGEEQSAYDLSQEAFLRAWQHFATVRGYAQPRSWLFRVATNLALTYLHRRAAPVGAATVLDELNDPAGSDPARQFIESEIVRQILLQLSPKRRAALVMREVYGLSVAEIAQALGMTIDAVKMTLYRAREQFRDLYAREDQL